MARDVNQENIYERKTKVSATCAVCDRVFLSYSTSSSFERCGGLMVSALDSGSSGLGSSTGRGHCVMLETLAFSNSLPLFIYLLHVDKRSVYCKRFFVLWQPRTQTALDQANNICGLYVKRILRATVKHCPIGVL